MLKLPVRSMSVEVDYTIATGSYDMWMVLLLMPVQLLIQMKGRSIQEYRRDMVGAMAVPDAPDGSAEGKHYYFNADMLLKLILLVIAIGPMEADVKRPLLRLWLLIHCRNLDSSYG